MKRHAIILVIALAFGLVAAKAMAEEPLQPIGGIHNFTFIDSDGDGVPNVEDNCPTVANPAEEVWPADGFGPPTLKQIDSDGDGVGDMCDNCPGVANEAQVDSDADGKGDACEIAVVYKPVTFPHGIVDLKDADDDGVIDSQDNCSEVANDDQADTDGDGIGDVCEDEDGDGVFDVDDNCVDVANDDQADTDGDGIGDACTDTDGDGVLDVDDNCVDVDNADQADVDGDGVGDVCDVSNDENADTGGGSCTLITGAEGNALSMLLVALGLIPLAVSRRK